MPQAASGTKAPARNASAKSAPAKRASAKKAATKRAAPEKAAPKSVTKAHTGSAVTWSWGTGTGHGKVVEVFTRPVSKTIKGKRITRKASPEKPAYLIEAGDGDRVLKSATEVESA